MLTESLVPPDMEARARMVAQHWQVALKTSNGQVIPVTCFTDGVLAVNLTDLYGDLRAQISTRKGLRQFTLRVEKVFSVRGETFYRYMPSNDIAVYYVERYLLDETVISPRPPRRRTSDPKVAALFSSGSLTLAQDI